MANANANNIQLVDVYDDHHMDDIIDHNLFPDNLHITLASHELEMQCDDASNRCQDAVTSYQQMITQNGAYFTNIKDLWQCLNEWWDDIKAFHGEVKKIGIVSENFKVWLPPFLYENNWIDESITNGKRLGYKQLRRYAKVEDKAYEFWYLYRSRNLVLPCDSLNGPFISNNNQIYSCHTLLKTIRREQSEWDDTRSVIQNFEQNPDWIYWYQDELPFYTIWSNAYDRRVFFQEQAEERGRRNLQSRNDNKVSKKFVTKKEFYYKQKIQSLEQKLERAQTEINRKENVIQYMMTNYNAVQIRNQQQQALLQQRYAPFGYLYNAYPQY